MIPKPPTFWAKLQEHMTDRERREFNAWRQELFDAADYALTAAEHVGPDADPARLERLRHRVGAVLDMAVGVPMMGRGGG